LNQAGWTVTVIWECELEDSTKQLVADLKRRKTQVRSERTR
jgi:G:T-mismatch repair DNA endonuclease (very short patch repair protein)